MLDRIIVTLNLPILPCLLVWPYVLRASELVRIFTTVWEEKPLMGCSWVSGINSFVVTEGGMGSGGGRDWGMMGTLPDSSISAPSRCARQQSQGTGRDSASSTSLAVRAAHGHIAKRRSWRVWWPTSRQEKVPAWQTIRGSLGRQGVPSQHFSQTCFAAEARREDYGHQRQELGRSVKHSCGCKWYCKFEQQSACTATLLKHHSAPCQTAGIETILTWKYKLFFPNAAQSVSYFLIVGVWCIIISARSDEWLPLPPQLQSV